MSAAHATCIVTGQVVRVSHPAGGAVAYLRDSSLAKFYYYFTVTDLYLVIAVNTAVASGVSTEVTGDASSCPTTGLELDGGVATLIRVQP